MILDAVGFHHFPIAPQTYATLQMCPSVQTRSYSRSARVEVKFDVTDFGNCSCSQPDSALQRDQVCFEKALSRVHNTTHTIAEPFLLLPKPQLASPLASGFPKLNLFQLD